MPNCLTTSSIVWPFAIRTSASRCFVTIVSTMCRFCPFSISPLIHNILFTMFKLDHFFLGQVNNSTLISILTRYVAIDANQILEQNRIIIQVRLFYAAILAGLVSYLYSNPKPLIALFNLLLILIMYLQEVHLKDLINRSENCYFIKCSAA